VTSLVRLRARTCLLLLVVPAIAQVAQGQERASSSKQSHIEVKRLPDAELTAYGTLDKAVRAANERLVFQLLNLTGTTYRMWYCGQPPFDDKVILEGMLAAARLSPEQLALFRRWYAAELRFSGHNAAVWRSMQAEQLMRGVECTEDQLASSRKWIEIHSTRSPTIR
jgi:hypothetical protein